MLVSCELFFDHYFDLKSQSEAEKFLNDRWRAAEGSGVQGFFINFLPSSFHIARLLASKKVVNAWGDNGRKASDLFVKSLLEARNEL
jgi:hypothetical protein